MFYFISYVYITFPPNIHRKDYFFLKRLFLLNHLLSLFKHNLTINVAFSFSAFFFFSIDCPVPQFWLLLFSYKIGNQEVWDLQIELCSHTPELFWFFCGASLKSCKWIMREIMPPIHQKKDWGILIVITINLLCGCFVQW